MLLMDALDLFDICFPLYNFPELVLVKLAYQWKKLKIISLTYEKILNKRVVSLPKITLKVEYLSK